MLVCSSTLGAAVASKGSNSKARAAIFFMAMVSGELRRAVYHEAGGDVPAGAGCGASVGG
ncbi:hypothetical protein D3C78_1663500 [compost metagenome]